MKTESILEVVSQAASLLQVADYLSRPQQFLAVAEARAELRQTLEEATKHSVVLTNNGEPQAAIVPFQTLEAMRNALMQLLVGEMRASFERLQHQVASQPLQQSNSQEQPKPTTEAELESLVKQARRRQAKANSSNRRKRRR